MKKKKRKKNKNKNNPFFPTKDVISRERGGKYFPPFCSFSLRETEIFLFICFYFSFCVIIFLFVCYRLSLSYLHLFVSSRKRMNPIDSDEKIKSSRHLPGMMVCWRCDRVLSRDCIRWMKTAWRTTERPFCTSCISVDEVTHQEFVDTMSYPDCDYTNVECLVGEIICWQCGIVMYAEYFYWMNTSRSGDERPFCPSCVFVCKRCHETFVDAMKDQHISCEIRAQPDSDDFIHHESKSDEEIIIDPSTLPLFR